MLGSVFDIFRLRQYFNIVTRARELAAGAFDDAGFLVDARRALAPLPFEGHGRRAPASPFPRREVRALAGLADQRIAIAATGGSGALASVVGVARAFEERAITPSAISLCSGSALFGFPLGAGMPADDVAAFVLGLRPRDYIDLDVRGLLSLPLRAGRGFSGILRGEAVEAAYRNLLGDLRLAELPIPVYAPLWDVDHNRLSHIGPDSHPDLPVARAVRMAIALPLFIQAVPLDGAWWCDGGIVDIFPVRPLIERVAPDAVVAVNGFYPTEFRGEDVTGWEDRSLSILYAASQVRTCQQIELARENLARLRRSCRVELIEPVPYAKVRGTGFYRQFFDNVEWSAFMQAGRTAALDALASLARRPAHRPVGPHDR
ncbi:MAG TPA: patatin-like phospholipase family protein [Acidimicrobiales bacterium]|nr:patatin-like phospholipase family protein [Acidimicrobiales bacterium]